MNTKNILFLALIILTTATVQATSPANLTLSTTSIGQIPSQLFGTVTHGNFMSNLSINKSSYHEMPYINYQKQRTAYSDAGLQVQRADMYLANVYTGLGNPGFEYPSVMNATIQSGGAYAGSRYWEINTYYHGGEDSNSVSCTFNITADAHSGQYAWAVNNTNTTGDRTCYPTQEIYMQPGQYNFSGWFKTNYSIELRVTNKTPYAQLCSVNTITKADWQQVGCLFNVTTPTKVQLFWIHDRNESAIVDDFAVTNIITGKEWVFVNETWTNSAKNLMQWTASNGTKVMWIVKDMPYYLANISKYCNSSASVIQTCAPENYTKFGKLVVDYLDRVTDNGLYASSAIVEVLNEPDLYTFFLYNASGNGQERRDYYNKVYDGVWTQVKAAYPTVPVGGPANYRFVTQTAVSVPFFQNWASNFSNKTDFVSIHFYMPTDGYPSNDFNSSLAYEISCLQNNMTFYNMSAKPIYITEFNNDNSSETSDWHYTNYSNVHDATMIMGVLNKGYTNITLIWYQWHESANETTASLAKWSMWSQPEYNNTYKPIYNITKDFNTYHKAGYKVRTVTINNATIYAMATSDATDYYILTIANDNQDIVNLTYTNTTNTVGVRNLKTLVLSRPDSNTGYTELGNIDGKTVTYWEVDTQNPRLSWISVPANGSTVKAGLFFTFSFNATDSNLDTTILVMNATSGGTETRTALNSFTSYGLTKPTGWYTYHLESNDTFGGSNTTSERWVYIQDELRITGSNIFDTALSFIDALIPIFGLLILYWIVRQAVSNAIQPKVALNYCIVAVVVLMVFHYIITAISAAI